MNLGHVGFGDHALREHYRQGWFYGCGVGYGYQWSLSRNWRMEVGLGLGYTRFDYDEYGCSICGGRLGEGSKNYWVLPEYHCRLSTVYDITKSDNLFINLKLLHYESKTVKFGCAGIHGFVCLQQ